MNKKIKYTCYLAGYIEAKPKGALNWRKEILKELKHDDLLIYSPTDYEAKKTGKPSGEHVKYVTGLKRGGYIEKFNEEMSKIWWGKVKPNIHRYDVIKLFKHRAIIDGNRPDDLNHWGDFESVARSDFVILKYKKSIPTWGTPAEAIIAFFLNIPIYVISDVTKTEMNSSLLWWVNETKGDVFYDLNKCVNFIKEKYNLKGEK